MRAIKSQLNTMYRAVIILLALMLFAGLVPLKRVDAASIEVDIPYEQSWTNDSGKTGLNSTFTYRLTAADSGSPLPGEASGGSYDFKLKGKASGALKLNFGFSRPGYYNYNVSQSIGTRRDGYTYDETSYNVMIMVVNGNEGLKVGAVTIQDSDLAKYSALEFSNKYYRARKAANNAGGTADVQTAAADTDDEVTPEAARPPQQEIEDTRPPLVERIGEDYWALLNLILMILTIVVSATDIGLYFRKDRDEDDEDESEEYEEDREERRRRRHLRLRTGTLIPSIGGLIFFLLTEDMSLPMELVDEWTIWMVVIFAVCTVFALLSRDRGDDEYEEYDS